MSATETFVGGPLGMVSHNIFNGNTSDGLLVGANLGATIQYNFANGNGTYGIVLGGGITGPSEVTDNTSLANGNLDLFDTIPGCTGHVWSGDTFFTANQNCIH